MGHKWYRDRDLQTYYVYCEIPFLMRYIRFDGKTPGPKGKLQISWHQYGKFLIFVENCKNSYVPSEYLTIDEKLETFRGRCSFKQFMPNKPNKYGVKIFALADAKMYYTKNMEVYVGTQQGGPFKVNNDAASIVKRLSEPVWNTGRNITIDNWFTSVKLVDVMLLNHRLTILGTIRKNKREIPPLFLNGKSVHRFQVCLDSEINPH
jgi:hypothetical protein